MEAVQGLSSGKTICQNVRREEQPSICAASSISTGMPETNEVNSSVPKPHAPAM